MYRKIVSHFYRNDDAQVTLWRNFFARKGGCKYHVEVACFPYGIAPYKLKGFHNWQSAKTYFKTMCVFGDKKNAKR